MNRGVLISFIVGLPVSLLMLYLAFRNVPFSELISYMASLDYSWVFGSLLLGFSTFFLRTLRWRIILLSTKRLGFWEAFHPLMIGFMMNSVLPGRVGEVARPVILKNNEKVPFTAGLATVAAERAFDTGFMIFLFAVVMAFVQIDPHFQITYGQYRLSGEMLENIGVKFMALLIPLLIGIVLVGMDSTRNLLKRAVLGIPNWLFFVPRKARQKIGQKVCEPLTEIFDNVAQGFKLIKDPGQMAICLLYTIAIWGFSALSLYLMTFGSPGVELSVTEATAVLIIICFFIALPSVPGFWGIWEAGGVFALSLFGISTKNAAGFTLVNHAVQMFPVILVGFGSAVLTGIRIRQITAVREKRLEITR